MAAQAEVQALLRFLTQDAKLPLGAAMLKYNAMRQEGLVNPETILRAEPSILQRIFDDQKHLRQVQNAAKRVSNPKKRSVGEISQPPSKRQKNGATKSDEEMELELQLPETDMSGEELGKIVIETNRAPLFLAFALTALKYTMPDQPLSSRLSLAQAVTSAGAQVKAKYIGLTEKTAEDEGWAQGQPQLKIMGREIAVMRRHISRSGAVEDSQQTIEADEENTAHDAFWGIDLDALRRSNGPLVAGKSATRSAGPPIFTPQAARSYLLKSVDTSKPVDKGAEDAPSRVKKKATAAEVAQRKEQAVAKLLRSLDLLFMSWASSLSTEELYRKAGNWYANTRPPVEPGQAGWGQRGQVVLSDVLKYRKSN